MEINWLRYSYNAFLLRIWLFWSLVNTVTLRSVFFTEHHPPWLKNADDAAFLKRLNHGWHWALLPIRDHAGSFLLNLPMGMLLNVSDPLLASPLLPNTWALRSEKSASQFPRGIDTLLGPFNPPALGAHLPAGRQCPLLQDCCLHKHNS